MPLQQGPTLSTRVMQRTLLYGQNIFGNWGCSYYSLIVAAGDRELALVASPKVDH
jgi:hypothetical protein